jgi:hypothetical protein
MGGSAPALREANIERRDGKLGKGYKDGCGGSIGKLDDNLGSSFKSNGLIEIESWESPPEK